MGVWGSCVSPPPGPTPVLVGVTRVPHQVAVSVRLEEHTELSRGYGESLTHGYGESLTHSYGAQPDHGYGAGLCSP